MPTSNPIEVFYLTFKPWWIVNPPSSSHACNRNCRLTFSTAPKFFNVLKFAAWPEYNNIFTIMTNEKCAQKHQQVHQQRWSMLDFFSCREPLQKKCDGCVLVEDGIVSFTMALANDPWYWTWVCMALTLYITNTMV